MRSVLKNGEAFSYQLSVISQTGKCGNFFPTSDAREILQQADFLVFAES
jgi:hypothetical protein